MTPQRGGNVGVDLLSCACVCVRVQVHNTQRSKGLFYCYTLISENQQSNRKKSYYCCFWQCVCAGVCACLCVCSWSFQPLKPTRTLPHWGDQGPGGVSAGVRGLFTYHDGWEWGHQGGKHFIQHHLWPVHTYINRHTHTACPHSSMSALSLLYSFHWLEKLGSWLYRL